MLFGRWQGMKKFFSSRHMMMHSKGSCRMHSAHSVHCQAEVTAVKQPHVHTPASHCIAHGNLHTNLEFRKLTARHHGVNSNRLFSQLAPASDPGNQRQRSAGAVHCTGSAHSASSRQPAARKRAKLFQDQPRHEPETSADPAAAGMEPSTAPQQQQQQQHSQLHQPPTKQTVLQQQDTEQQRQLSLAEAAASQHVFVFWDLDNKNPSEWLEMPSVIENLKSTLSRFGRVASISAYSNINTLTWVVPGEMGYGGDDKGGDPVAAYEDSWGLSSVEKQISAQDDLRCPLCGRRCKSIEDRNKHFRQLHQREHEKKLGAGKKHAKKYLETDKAERYRAAYQQMALPRANRSGRKGQMVKLLLQKYGVTLKEVSNERQAVDLMIKAHITNLSSTLRSQMQQQHDPEQQQQQQQLQQQHNSKKPKQKGAFAVPASAVMPASVLVLVTDDRGFRDVARNWLQQGGVGVVMVSSRDPMQWDTATWKMSNDQRVAWLDWYNLL